MYVIICFLFLTAPQPTVDPVVIIAPIAAVALLLLIIFLILIFIAILWVPHDCHMTIMTVTWPLHDCHMTTWLSHDHDCHMTIAWLHKAITWLSHDHHDCHMTIMTVTWSHDLGDFSWGSNIYVLYAVRPCPIWQEKSFRTSDTPFFGEVLGTRLLNIDSGSANTQAFKLCCVHYWAWCVELYTY